MNSTPSPSSCHDSGFIPSDTHNHPSSGTRTFQVRRVPSGRRDGDRLLGFAGRRHVSDREQARHPVASRAESNVVSRSIRATLPPRLNSHQPRRATPTMTTAVRTARLPLIGIQSTTPQIVSTSCNPRPSASREPTSDDPRPVSDQRCRRSLTAARVSRSASRRLIVSRLSWAFLPLARLIATFT